MRQIKIFLQVVSTTLAENSIYCAVYDLLCSNYSRKLNKP